MSADNWTVCPKCRRTRDNEFNAQARAVRDSYGSVTPDEFVAAMKNLSVAELDETMREDYEIGLDPDGKFTVSYSCFCETCGFRWTYKHAQHVVASSAQE